MCVDRGTEREEIIQSPEVAGRVAEGSKKQYTVRVLYSNKYVDTLQYNQYAVPFSKP